MMYVKEIWKLLNTWLGDNPMGIIFSITIMFVIFRVIPHTYKWWKGEIKKDKDEREKSRASISSIENTVETQTGKLTKIESHLGEINGNFQEHVNAIDIHVPKDEIVPKILFDERTLNIQSDIKAIFLILDK